MFLGVPPGHVYKGVEEGGGPALYGATWRSPTPTGSRIPPSLVGLGEEGRGREGGQPPTQFGLGLGGGAPPPRLLSPLSHYGPTRPISSPGGSGNPRYSGKCPNSSETIPVSKHSSPIYQSLCLDHFETRSHVCDHIRDSKLPSVHQN